jgi:hypothetical protein
MLSSKLYLRLWSDLMDYLKSPNLLKVIAMRNIDIDKIEAAVENPSAKFESSGFQVYQSLLDSSDPNNPIYLNVYISNSTNPATIITAFKAVIIT